MNNSASVPLLFGVRKSQIFLENRHFAAENLCHPTSSIFSDEFFKDFLSLSKSMYFIDGCVILYLRLFLYSIEFTIVFAGLQEKLLNILSFLVVPKKKGADIMIVRHHYMELLKIYRDVQLVKILAGIRRCGKSTILEMLQDDLIKCDVSADYIISMRYTSEDFEEGMDDRDMYNGIKEKIIDGGRYYLLLDKMQEVTGWEKDRQQSFGKDDTDIYVTSSNSKLMSIEISTYLTGRYISIPVFHCHLQSIWSSKK